MWRCTLSILAGWCASENVFFCGPHWNLLKYRIRERNNLVKCHLSEKFSMNCASFCFKWLLINWFKCQRCNKNERWLLQLWLHLSRNRKLSSFHRLLDYIIQFVNLFQCSSIAKWSVHTWDAVSFLEHQWLYNRALVSFMNQLKQMEWLIFFGNGFDEELIIVGDGRKKTIK